MFEEALKVRLYQYCRSLLQDRMAEAAAAMMASQQDGNSETKSSAGDKYETGRAMAQLEKERHARRRAMLEDDLLLLERIGCSSPCEQITEGSLVRTTLGVYYLTVGLGPIDYEDALYNVISLDSPIGQVLLGLEVGDEDLFRGRTLEVLEII